MDEICEEMRNLCREAMRNGVRCKYRSDVGHSADRILRAVEDSQADLIIIGRNALNDPTGWKPDSGLSRILRWSSCPVTVIK